MLCSCRVIITVIVIVIIIVIVDSKDVLHYANAYLKKKKRLFSVCSMLATLALYVLFIFRLLLNEVDNYRNF